MRRFGKKTTLACATLAFTWMACTALHASECPGPKEPARNLPERKSEPADENATFGSVRIVFGGVGNAAVEDKDSSYELSCGALELEAGPVGGSFKMMRFSWDRPQDYIVDTKGRDPWGDLYEIAVRISHGGAVTSNMHYKLVLGATSGFENETDDSFSFQGGGHGIYQINAKWAIAAGVLYSKHQKVETDFEFIPVACVSWNQGTDVGPSFNIGLPVTEIAWNFSKNTALTLDTNSFESGVYRLADNNPAREKGYIEFSGMTCTLHMDTMILDRIRLSAGVSYALTRDHKLYDRNGNNELKYDVEKKPGFIFSMSASF